MICVPIFEKNYDSVFKLLKILLNAGADLLEFRIDIMDNPNPDDVSKHNQGN